MKEFLGQSRRLFRQAIKNLLEHKLRGFLTTLGIIFGVGSVIAMLAIGEGASYEAREQIRRLGSDNIIVNSVRPPNSSRNVGRHGSMILTAYGLTYQDLFRLEQLYPQITIKVPSRLIRQNVRHNGIEVPAQFVGTLPSYLRNSGLRVVAGRFITESDIFGTSNVCVIRESTARLLFPLAYPLGQTIRCQKKGFTVVGIVRDDKQSSEKQGVSIHDFFMPLSAAQRRFGEITAKDDNGVRTLEEIELHQLVLTAPSPEEVVPLANAVSSTLARQHPQHDFEVVVPQELLRQAEASKRIFSIVLGSIAAISLLVGGIGVMNIMLATVTERTREIGVRRALGATREDIVRQFMVESLILTLSGGTIGIGLGVGLPLVVEHFTSMKAIVTLPALGVAFGLSAVTGLVFGIYPAVRAAAMSPIEALRHE